MKVSKINTFFRKVGEGQIKHRKLCIAILLIWTLICLSGMRNFVNLFSVSLQKITVLLMFM